MGSKPAGVLLALFLWMGSIQGEITRPNFTLLPDRPPHTEHARLARWLVHAASWGTISTTSTHLDGIAFGNALSYSDGPIGHSTGRLLFYLTLMDATATDAAAHPNATLTLCEAQLPGGCEGVDPEDPTCAKLSITGELAPVRGGADAEAEARALLFARHPQMADWPSGHEFRVYELMAATLRLLDFYGGPHDISPDEYFAAAVGVAGRAAESFYRADYIEI